MEKKHRRFLPVLITLGALILTLGISTLYFRGIQSPSLFPSNILVLTLVNINLILVVLLVLLLSRNLIKLYFERRHKLLGATFRTKLIAAFVGLSLIPSVLLFIVASGLLTSSIENWFSTQVEKSLNVSLEVAQDYYQKTKNETAQFSRKVRNGILARGMDMRNSRRLNQFLDNQRSEFNLDGIEVYSPSLEVRGASRNQSMKGNPIFVPPRDLIEEAVQGEKSSRIYSSPHGDLVQIVLPLSNGSSTPVEDFLVVSKIIPPDLVKKMATVTKTYEDYKLLQAFKNPIKGSYLLSFLIITLLIIFSATWFGFYLARGITVPIQKLVDGTHAVAQGDLDFRIQAQTSDEIGNLVDSFNKMTEDLKASKSELEAANRSLQESNLELEQRRAYTETIMENIATGVLSINPEGNIITFNRSAEKILHIKAEAIKNRPYEQALVSMQLTLLKDLIQRAKILQSEPLQQEIQLDVQQKPLILRVKISNLMDDFSNFQGVVVTFDDLTELIKAQKVATWQEVARRIAHEIKNPLTPIQLSSQRLRKKYYEGGEDFPSVLEESTRIIINEVNSLKTLVDEFSNFARMPSPVLVSCDLYKIIHEVIILYQGSHPRIEIIYQGPQNFPPLFLDREQIKRVFINLFENAIQAMKKHGRLWVSASWEEAEKKVRVEVADEGVGIHPDDFDKLFIPYFSRKKTGTGLGLAIVHRIVTDHNGQIRAMRNIPQGTNFVIELPVST